jgi:hypothetical protein
MISSIAQAAYLQFELRPSWIVGMFRSLHKSSGIFPKFFPSFSSRKLTIRNYYIDGNTYLFTDNSQASKIATTSFRLLESCSSQWIDSLIPVGSR